MDYSKIKKKISLPRDGQDVLLLRTATVAALGTNGKLSLTMSDGSTVTNVPYLVSSGVAVGTVVQVLTYRGSLLVIGTAAGSSQSVGGEWATEITADQAATTAVAGFTVFTVTLPAAGTYAFDAHFLYTIATGTTAPGFALGGTATVGSFRWTAQVIPYSTTTGLESTQSNGVAHPTNVSQLLNNLLAINTGFGSIVIRGRITVTAGGTLTFRIGRQAGTGSVTVRQSSNARVRWVNLV